MKRLSSIVLALAASLVLSAPLGAETATWTSDPVHSAALFSVRHMMVSNVRGEITKFTATVTGDPKEPEKATMEATFDMSSINTRNDKRDAHLKSPDFFDVAKFPTMTFKSKKIEGAGLGRLTVTGDLTIHGVTKQVILGVEGPTPEVAAGGAVMTGATATTRISRKEYGVDWSKKLPNGDLIVGDVVTITLELELNRKVEAPAPAAPAK